MNCQRCAQILTPGTAVCPRCGALAGGPETVPSPAIAANLSIDNTLGVALRTVFSAPHLYFGAGALAATPGALLDGLHMVLFPESLASGAGATPWSLVSGIVNIFAFGFPVKILLTLTMLGLTFPLLPPALDALMEHATRAMLSLKGG